MTALPSAPAAPAPAIIPAAEEPNLFATEEPAPAVVEAAAEEPLFADEPAAPAQPPVEDNIFGAAEDPAPVEQPTEAPVVEPADDDLFGEDAPATDDAGDDLFGDEPSKPAADDDLFGDEPAAADDDDLFGEPDAEPAGDDDLFGDETKPEDVELDDSELDDLFNLDEGAPGEDLFGNLRAPGGLQSRELRMWTDNSGLFRTLARLESIEKNSVHLVGANGQVAVVPLARLSGGDLDFVQAQNDLSRMERVTRTAMR